MQFFRSCLTAGVMGLAVTVWPLTALARSVVEVDSAAGLHSALAAAGADTVLRLAPGDYGDLSLRDRRFDPSAPLVIQSANPAQPARFSGMTLRDVAHLRLEGLVFDYTFQPDQPLNFRPFQIVRGAGLVLRGNLFDGALATGVSAEDDGSPAGFGLTVRDTAGIAIEDNELRDFYRALVISGANDVVVRGNDVHAIRMDGMNFAQVEQVLIEDNVIRDFKRVMASNDHADMIQFWTARTDKPSTGITIRNNILNSGTGWFTQSIFMRNELVDTGKAGPEMFYRDVTIEGNVIINAHLHGITIGETNGLVIRNNSVLRNARSEGTDVNPGLWTPQIRVSPTATNVVIERNVTNKVAGYANQADWAVANNFEVQDRFPGQPGFYDQVFVAARTGDPGDLASFAALAGGPLAGRGLGAPRLDPAASRLPSGQELRPVARVIADPALRNKFRFEATTSGLPEGVAPGAVEYLWNLGDGTEAEGAAVEHLYQMTGPIIVTLTARLPDGRRVSTESQVSIQGPEVLVFDVETGNFTSFAPRDPTIVPNLNLGRGPIVLGQGVAPVMIPPPMIEPLFHSTDFELTVRVRGVVGARSGGELLSVPKTLLVNVTDRGILEIRFDTDGAEALRIKTSVVHIYSGDWVDLTFGYSASKQRFYVMANGKLIGQGRSFGRLRPLEHWGLALGNPFANRKSFDGELSYLNLRVGDETFAATQ